MWKSSCHSEPLCQQNKPLVNLLETVFGIDRESREGQWQNSSNRSKLSRGSSAVSIRLFNHSIRELSHPSPMDGFIASVRSGVNEGKVVGFKEAFRWLCVYALFKQLLITIFQCAGPGFVWKTKAKEKRKRNIGPCTHHSIHQASDCAGIGNSWHLLSFLSSGVFWPISRLRPTLLFHRSLYRFTIAHLVSFTSWCKSLETN